MIGRDGPVKPFELIRWAREQAAVHRLRTLEAHVLLLLATYADQNGVAWPSIKTLALRSGLKPTKEGRNSAVSAALARLEELRLVWTTQGGHGRPARRELLFNPSQPSASQDGCGSAETGQPSGYADGSSSDSGAADSAQPSGYQDVQPSGYQDQKYQGNCHELPRTPNGQESRPATRTALPPASQDGQPIAVRRLILSSLASTGAPE